VPRTAPDAFPLRDARTAGLPVPGLTGDFISYPLEVFRPAARTNLQSREKSRTLQVKIECAHLIFLAYE